MAQERAHRFVHVSCMWRGNRVKAQSWKLSGSLRVVTTVGWSLAVTRKWPVAENWLVLKALFELMPPASSLPVEGGGGSFPILEKNFVILKRASRKQACFQSGLIMDEMSCLCCYQMHDDNARADAATVFCNTVKTVLLLHITSAVIFWPA